MREAGFVSTGLTWLDQLLGKLRVGENVVWEIEAGAPMEAFVRAFLRDRAEEQQRKSVCVSFNHSPVTMKEKLGDLFDQPQLILVDCFTDGKGRGDPVFARFYDTGMAEDLAHVVRVREPANVDAFIAAINQIETEAGEGARYVFDSLTGMQDLWIDPARAYRFFTYACPRLYDLRTVAYWILQKEAHTASFRANLQHVTQVAIELAHSEGGHTLKLVKAGGRALGAEDELPQRYGVVQGELRLVTDSRRELQRLGRAIRAARSRRGLSQSELGETLGVTASTISQVENGLIALSLPNLLGAARELDLNLAPIFTPRRAVQDPVSIMRQRDRPRTQVAGSKRRPAYLENLRDLETESDLDPMLVTIPSGVRLAKHFSTRKGAEFGLLLSGELEMEIAGQSRTLRSGDAIYLHRDAPSAWSNKGADDAELIWVVVTK
jgi:transcriptional regulator with XRE-family HTH domain/KaiC/GvpD/RAD55 family RecA-like ATPase